MKRSNPLGPVVMAPVVLGVVLVGVWAGVTATGVVSPYFLPPPGELVQDFADQVSSGALPRYAGVTVLESLAGCALGAAVALPMGYLIAHRRIAEAALQPYLAASQAMPAVAIAPLLALWLGYGLLPIAVLCALLVFFPILVNTVLGLRSIDPDLPEAARVDGVGRWGMLWHIEVPLALPSVLAGVRNGFTLSITGAVVGEFVVGGEGLGQLLTAQRGQADTLGMFSTLLMLGLLAWVFYGVIRFAERRARW